MLSFNPYPKSIKIQEQVAARTIRRANLMADGIFHAHAHDGREVQIRNKDARFRFSTTLMTFRMLLVHRVTLFIDGQTIPIEVLPSIIIQQTCPIAAEQFEIHLIRRCSDLRQRLIERLHPTYGHRDMIFKKDLRLHKYFHANGGCLQEIKFDTMKTACEYIKRMAWL